MLKIEIWRLPMNDHPGVAAVCPSRDELAAFALGKLPSDELTHIAEHLDGCAQCEAAFAALADRRDHLMTELACRADEALFDDQEADRVIAIAEAAGGPRSAPERDDRATPDPDRIRDYRLLARLGEGGMGTVYKAQHTKLDTTVAVKVVRKERLTDAATVDRFEREMKAVGKIRHLNIVQALDAGEEDGRHYLVMEFVDGVDLETLVRRRGPLPIAEACEIVRQAAIGSQAVLEAGLVHRDMKPSNLMLARDGRVKVLDLGLARLEAALTLSESATSADRVMGTSEYMSPEQVLDTHQVDIRADIYALGCTLYFLLTGQAPFCKPKYPTPLKRLMAHVNEPVRPIRQLREDVPEGLYRAIGTLLSKQPDDRPATPAALAESLVPFTEGSDLKRLLAESEIEQASVSTADHRPAATLASTRSRVKHRKSFATPHAAEAPPRWRRWLLASAVGLAGALALAVILITTDRGTLEVRILDDEAVQVTVEKNGQQVKIIDTKTDSTVTLRSGEYEVSVKDREADFAVEPDGFTLRRGDEIVVTVKKIDRPAAKAGENTISGRLDSALKAERPSAAKVIDVHVPSTEVLEFHLPSVLSPEEGAADAAKERVLPNGWRVGQAAKLTSPVNRRFQPHEPSLTADGLALYFATWVAPSLGGGGSEIFECRRTRRNELFGEPVRVNINSEFDDTAPFISADGLTLTFASNRPGGAGDKDLWITTRKSSEDPWNPPVNLGPKVNSSDEDWKPALSVDGLALVFSSWRFGGEGSEDLWMSMRPSRDGSWSAPVNLGPAVNSVDSETSPCLSSDKLALFFHRKREGEEGQLIMMCTRSSVDASFGEPVSLGPTVNIHNAGQVFVTPDDRVLYFTIGRDNEQDIYFAPIKRPEQ
jgi:serine/threonine protein kinase